MDIRRRRRHRRLEMESKDQLSHSKRDVADGGRRRLLRRHGRKFLCTRHSKRRQIVGPKPWGRNRRRRDHVFGQWETKDRRCKRPDRDSVANRNHNRQGINTWIRVIPAVVISPCFYKIFRFKRGLYSDSSGIFRGAKQSAIPLFSGGSVTPSLEPQVRLGSALVHYFRVADELGLARYQMTINSDCRLSIGRPPSTMTGWARRACRSWSGCPKLAATRLFRPCGRRHECFVRLFKLRRAFHDVGADALERLHHLRLLVHRQADDLTMLFPDVGLLAVKVGRPRPNLVGGLGGVGLDDLLQVGGQTVE